MSSLTRLVETDAHEGPVYARNEDVLYVGDSGAPRHIAAFDVVEGHRLTHRRVVAHSTPQHPDGLKVDDRGRLYASAADAVRIYEPTGAQVGEIAVAGAVNFTFGGRDGDALFITADDAVWVAALNSRS